MTEPEEYRRRLISSSKEVCLYLYPALWLISRVHWAFGFTTIQNPLKSDRRFPWLPSFLNQHCKTVPFTEGVTILTSKSPKYSALAQFCSHFLKDIRIQTSYQINKTNIRKLTTPHFWRVIPNPEETDTLDISDTSLACRGRGKVYIVYENIINSQTAAQVRKVNNEMRKR